MRKFQKSLRIPSHRESGMSMIELLTCVMIIGIATAGSMELAYVNAFWAANGLNKADNLYAARRFLDTLNRDLRNSARVSQQWSPPDTILTLSRSEDIAKQQLSQSFDSSGFPTLAAMTEVQYKVTPDPNSTDTAITEYLIQRAEGGGSFVTILTGVVGPINPSGSPNLGIFQYSSATTSSGTTDGLTNAPSSQTNSVIVNLELKRVSSSTTAMNQNTSHSFEAIRAEIFLRNSTLGQGI